MIERSASRKKGDDDYSGVREGGRWLDGFTLGVVTGLLFVMTACLAIGIWVLILLMQLGSVAGGD